MKQQVVTVPGRVRSALIHSRIVKGEGEGEGEGHTWVLCSDTAAVDKACIKSSISLGREQLKEL